MWDAYCYHDQVTNIKIWPMLLLKAILKAYSYKYMRDTERDDELVGKLGVNKNLFDTNLEP